MDPKERTFIAEDPAYQAKPFGATPEDDPSIFVHASVLDQVLSEAQAHRDAPRAGGLFGAAGRAGARRFVEIEAASPVEAPRPPAAPFALEDAELQALHAAAGRAGLALIGLYVTHPGLGLYLSRSEAAYARARFDAAWCVTLVVDPSVDKLAFFRFRGDAPAKSGFWSVTRQMAPPPASKPRGDAQLTREELFRLATEEVFKDGQVDEEENRTLQTLGGLLRLDRETAIRLAKQARKKFKAGELSGKGSLDAPALYKRAVAFAVQDGELEADEAHILAALRILLKIDETKSVKSAESPFRKLLTEHAGVAFERQVHALERLGDHDFSWDLGAGTIVLAGATYTMQALGVVNDDLQTWTWAWATAQQREPLPEHILADARRVQSYGAERAIPELARPVSKLADATPDELAMVASGLRNAYLYYRLPYPGGALYVLVTDPAFGRTPLPPVGRIALMFPRLLESVAVPPRRALAAYIKACGLELSEGAAVVVGKAKEGERVVASFDESGRLVDIRTDP